MKTAGHVLKSKSCAEPPVMLNGWKHHTAFLLDQVQRWSKKPEQLFPLFVAKLKMLGDSQFDIYNGDLSPDEIAHDVAKILEGFNVYEQDAYLQWIERSPQLFWQVNISDGSEWTLRKGDDAGEETVEEPDECYIHIHPARHSKYTYRLKANQLRTALATLVMANMRNEKPGLPMLNKVRQEYLGLSPVTKPLAKEIFEVLNDIAERAGVDH